MEDEQVSDAPDRFAGRPPRRRLRWLWTYVAVYSTVAFSAMLNHHNRFAIIFSVLAGGMALNAIGEQVRLTREAEQARKRETPASG